WIALFIGLIWVLGAIGVVYFELMDIKTASLLAFALSFSSTVCVVKVLEESGEMKTRHGKLAIGLLVMQDVIAVIFLVIVTGVTPSIWALALVLLYWLKPLIGR